MGSEMCIRDSLMKLGQRRRSGAAQLGDGKREEPPVEPHRPGALDRVDQLGGVFLAEHPRLGVGTEVEGTKLFHREVEQIKWA